MKTALRSSRRSTVSQRLKRGPSSIPISNVVEAEGPGITVTGTAWAIWNNAGLSGGSGRGNNGANNSDTLTWAFTVPEDTLMVFETYHYMSGLDRTYAWRLDGGAWSANQTISGSDSYGNPGYLSPVLTPGAHTFEIKAVSGNPNLDYIRTYSVKQTPVSTPSAFVASQSGAIEPGTNLVINTPAGIQAGDVLLAFIIDNTSQNLTLPSDWVQLSRVNGYTVAYKIATASEPASYTFSAASSYRGGVIVAYRGGTPSLIVTGTGLTAGKTMARPNARVVGGFGESTLTGYGSPGSGWTYRGDAQSTNRRVYVVDGVGDATALTRPTVGTGSSTGKNATVQIL